MIVGLKILLYITLFSGMCLCAISGYLMSKGDFISFIFGAIMFILLFSWQIYVVENILKEK